MYQMRNNRLKPSDEGKQEYSKAEQSARCDWVPEKAKNLIADLVLRITCDQLAELEGEAARSSSLTWVRQLVERWPVLAKAFCQTIAGEAVQIEDLGDWEVVAVPNPVNGSGCVLFRMKANGL